MVALSALQKRDRENRHRKNKQNFICYFLYLEEQAGCMPKIPKLFLLLLFSLAEVVNYAQNKYALVVGINDYYQSPGVKSPESLHGCVNDAYSIKSLLTKRFRFDDGSITTIINEKATSENVINALLTILNKSKAGDAVVFYYSGHGAWLYNSGYAYDTIKNGLSQAMCMSNLYAPGWGCLLRDATVKKIANKFVDKKVVFTTIFDCCFSGNLMAMPSPDYYHPLTRVEDKSINIGSIPYIETDSLRLITEQNNPDPNENLEDTFLLSDDTTFDSQLRSFNLKQVPTIVDAEKIARPFERKESKFVSLAATTDHQKGLEIIDEANVHHGAFTKALINVYKMSPPNLPMAQG